MTKKKKPGKIEAAVKLGEAAFRLGVAFNRNYYNWNEHTLTKHPRLRKAWTEGWKKAEKDAKKKKKNAE